MSDHFDLTLPGARVVFSTRRGGVSEGPFESLNLGLWTDDEPDRVIENRDRLRRHAGAEHIALGRQVHGVDLQEWTAHPGPGDPPEVDGHLTRERGLGLLVQVADCLPVALVSAGPGGDAALWLARAGGWHHRQARSSASTSRRPPPSAPASGSAATRSARRWPPSSLPSVDRRPRGESHLDLRGIAREQLGEAAAVLEVDLCTSCHPELFFSHRRDNGVTGRQAGVVVRDGS